MIMCYTKKYLISLELIYRWFATFFYLEILIILIIR